LHLTSFQPLTLRPPIRANPSTRGFAGGRNVGEAKRANASVANPDEGAEPGEATEELRLGVSRWKSPVFRFGD